MDELKPCPWCKNPVFVDVTDDEGNYPKAPGYEKDPYSGLCYVLIHDYNNDDNHYCPIGTHPGEFLGLLYNSKESAISSWNRRTESKESGELPEWLQEKIKTGIKYAEINFEAHPDLKKYMRLKESLEWVLSLKRGEE
jgi:hypothetical protein